MVCSALELGLSDEHDGILVLDADIEAGVSLSSVLADQIIETELTPNRPDCLSIIGTAYEVAAPVAILLIVLIIRQINMKRNRQPAR